MFSLLVAYQGRKKPIRVDKLDLETITTMFLEVFDLEGERITVSFQRYDITWEEDVELDPNDEIFDKDKLTAIVTTLPSEKVNQTAVGNSMDSQTPVAMAKSSCSTLKNVAGSTPKIPSNTSIRRRYFLDSDEEQSETRMVKPRLLTATDDITEEQPQDLSCNINVKSETKRFIKTEADSIPLPEPYPLPLNYRSDVEAGLKKKEMSLELKKAFFSSIAASMFSYKKYPTGTDYLNVATTIVQKYPFLKSAAGSSIDGISQSLRDRFKELRRTRKPRAKAKVVSSPMPESSTTAKLSPGITSPISSPVVPEGEDSHSFKRHCKFIQQEYKGKKNPNMTVVDNLAEMSFAMRWQDLHSNAYSIENVFEKYPFLESSTQLIAELGRYLGKPNFAEESEVVWKDLTGKIVRQAKIESGSNSRIRKALEGIDMEENGSNLPLALSLLVYMLPDVRTTPNSDKVIFFTEDSDIHQTVQKREMPHPYILVENANTIEAQCHLVTDCQIICQGKVSQIPALLLAAFYVFNICYPPGCKNFYSFMEVIILGNPIKKAAPSVKHVYASLFN